MTNSAQVSKQVPSVIVNVATLPECDWRVADDWRTCVTPAQASVIQGMEATGDVEGVGAAYVRFGEGETGDVCVFFHGSDTCAVVSESGDVEMMGF